MMSIINDQQRTKKVYFFVSSSESSLGQRHIEIMKENIFLVIFLLTFYHLMSPLNLR